MNHPEADTDTVSGSPELLLPTILLWSCRMVTALGWENGGWTWWWSTPAHHHCTLLQNPNLLILDEATSALDYDTESTVCMNLQQTLMGKGKTVFFITHRLSTVRHADQLAHASGQDCRARD